MEERINSFGVEIESENRWVQLAEQTLWHELEQIYKTKVDAATVHPEVSAKTVIAVLTIKYKLNLSDNEVVRMIAENPYFQYFLGVEKFNPKWSFPAHVFARVKNKFDHQEWENFKRIILHGTHASIINTYSLRTNNNSDKVFPVIEKTDEGKTHHRRGMSRTERREKRLKKKIKKRIKKVYTYFIWFVLVSLIAGSLIAFFSQNEDVFKSQQAIDKKNKMNNRR